MSPIEFVISEKLQKQLLKTLHNESVIYPVLKTVIFIRLFKSMKVLRQTIPAIVM
jgi:hypothetical protein